MTFFYLALIYDIPFKFLADKVSIWTASLDAVINSITIGYAFYFALVVTDGLSATSDAMSS
jgi:hypothetical protein